MQDWANSAIETAKRRGASYAGAPGKKGVNPNHPFVALTHSKQTMERMNKCQEIQGVFNHP